MPVTRYILISLGLSFSFFLKAQIISQFTWDSNPITTAIVGPNATSAGATATSSPGGVGGTNGLNPGAPSPATDINLTIPNTSNVFDVPNVDISIDYRRNESTAHMVKRNNFTFNTGSNSGNFNVTFRVDNGAGVPITVTGTNYPIPQDATFRTYRFTYDNCTGVGTMYVNNTVVWASPTPTANQNLYWTGEGNVVIGSQMDGANNNIPNLDNFIWRTYTCSTLPIELSSFSGVNEGPHNFLQWSTASEKNNNFFTLERSIDGQLWKDVAKVYGAGNSNVLKRYSTYDEAPEPTINYYRLRQTDFDGHSKTFSIITIDNSLQGTGRPVSVTDLLGREVELNAPGIKFIRYSNGTVIRRADE